ncbi:ribonuclease D, partial [Rhodococcus hoagii]|nr:ribonuclease D [Prescottella equi]
MPDSTEPTTPVPLLVPAAGVPPVIETAAGVRDAAERPRPARPLAVDAERASGIRYSSRAYPCSFWRAGPGSFPARPDSDAEDLEPLRDAI